MKLNWNLPLESASGYKAKLLMKLNAEYQPYVVLFTFKNGTEAVFNFDENGESSEAETLHNLINSNGYYISRPTLGDVKKLELKGYKLLHPEDFEHITRHYNIISWTLSIYKLINEYIISLNCGDISGNINHYENKGRFEVKSADEIPYCINGKLTWDVPPKQYWYILSGYSGIKQPSIDIFCIKEEAEEYLKSFNRDDMWAKIVTNI